MGAMTPLEISPIGTEALDSPSCTPDVARATLRDIAVANALFGGRAAVAHGIDLLLRSVTQRALTVLDVGAGMGDVACYLAKRFKRRVSLRSITLDWHPEAARLCQQRQLVAMVADAAALPLRARSVDIVVASQFLHHFTREAATHLIKAFDSIARLGVVVADIERTRIAALAIRIASFALLFHPASRHDGVVSVQRAFTKRELKQLLEEAGIAAVVHRRPGYRLVATWRSAHAHR